mmetsp:Transcript_55721/g.156355  ORF Transcript_55721/g.156355 Transcript_55721/m.156355 type:complete len:288 (-) Transcript_55721:3-866(-)
MVLHAEHAGRGLPDLLRVRADHHGAVELRRRGHPSVGRTAPRALEQVAHSEAQARRRGLLLIGLRGAAEQQHLLVDPRLQAVGLVPHRVDEVQLRHGEEAEAVAERPAGATGLVLLARVVPKLWEAELCGHGADGGEGHNLPLLLLHELYEALCRRIDARDGGAHLPAQRHHEAHVVVQHLLGKDHAPAGARPSESAAAQRPEDDRPHYGDKPQHLRAHRCVSSDHRHPVRQLLAHVILSRLRSGGIRRAAAGWRLRLNQQQRRALFAHLCALSEPRKRRAVRPMYA